jgi:hypothetical protein
LKDIYGTRVLVGFDQDFDYGLAPHVCPLDQRVQ